MMVNAALASLVSLSTTVAPPRISLSLQRNYQIYDINKQGEGITVHRKHQVFNRANGNNPHPDDGKDTFNGHSLQPNNNGTIWAEQDVAMVCEANANLENSYAQKCPLPVAHAWDLNDHDITERVTTRVFAVDGEYNMSKTDTLFSPHNGTFDETRGSEANQFSPRMHELVNSEGINWANRGTYLFKYDAIDKSGLRANQVVFALILDDATPPVIKDCVSCGPRHDRPAGAVPDRYFNYSTSQITSESSNFLTCLEASGNLAKYDTNDCHCLPNNMYTRSVCRTQIGTACDAHSTDDGNDNVELWEAGSKWHHPTTDQDHKAVEEFSDYTLCENIARDENNAQDNDLITDAIKYQVDFYAVEGNYRNHVGGSKGNPALTTGNLATDPNNGIANATNLCGDCSYLEARSLINSDTQGVYYLRLDTTDRAGMYGVAGQDNAAAQYTKYILIEDTTPPWIEPVWTANPGSTGKKIEHECGKDFHDYGASAFDLYDSFAQGKNITVNAGICNNDNGQCLNHSSPGANTWADEAKIHTFPQVNSQLWPEKILRPTTDLQFNNRNQLPFTYTMKYDATDSSGHNAVQQQVQLVIEDTSPPEIELVGPNVIIVEVNDTETYDEATFDAKYELGIHCRDTCWERDGAMGDMGTAAAVKDQYRSYNWLDEFSYQKVACYTRRYQCLHGDSGRYGNETLYSMNQTRKFCVRDKQVPVITIKGLSSETYEASHDLTYTDKGATCSDWIDGDISRMVEVSGQVVDMTSSGTYTLRYDCMDLSGNAAVPRTRTIHVHDSTCPVIAPITTETLTVEAGFPYLDEKPTATDTLDGDVSAFVWSDGNTVNTAGLTGVSCEDIHESWKELLENKTAANNPARYALLDGYYWIDNEDTLTKVWCDFLEDDTDLNGADSGVTPLFDGDHDNVQASNSTYFLCEQDSVPGCGTISTDAFSSVVGGPQGGCPPNFHVATKLEGNVAKHYFDTGTKDSPDYFKNQDVYVYDNDDLWTRHLGADGVAELKANQNNFNTYVCYLNHSTTTTTAPGQLSTRWSYDGTSTSNDVKGAHKFLTASLSLSDGRGNTHNESGKARVGKYQIAYHVQDQMGNWECTTRYRTVYVEDTLPPVLALHYDGGPYFQTSGAHGIAQQSKHKVFKFADNATNFDQTNTFPEGMLTSGELGENPFDANGPTSVQTDQDTYLMQESQAATNGWVVAGIASSMVGLVVVAFSRRQAEVTIEV